MEVKEKRRLLSTVHEETGHTHLTHVQLISKDPASICNVCNINLTIERIIVNCPEYSKARQILNNPPSRNPQRREHCGSRCVV